MKTLDIGEHQTQAVRRALAAIPINDLHIEVVGEHVYLHGVVGCYDSKRDAAARAAAAVPGACIVNELRVAQGDFIDDERIAREAARALARFGEEVLERVRIEARDGVVHLSGTARNPEERQALASAAWGASCVSRVDNHLVVDEETLDSEVAQALSEYVSRAMNLMPGTIVVGYAAGVASLTGSVASVSQGQAIEDLVRWHDRVKDVVNHLRVAPRAAMQGPRKVV